MENVEHLPDSCIAAVEWDSKVLNLMNSALLRDIFFGAGELTPTRKEDAELSPENLLNINKFEPQSPISCCKSLFEGLDLVENPLRTNFPAFTLPDKVESAESLTSSCMKIFDSKGLEENRLKVDFPDIRHVYFKAQSRVNRTSKQRIIDSRVKIRVTTRAPQVQSIEVYVERTAAAAVLVGSECGRVSLKAKTGSHLLNKYNFTVDLDSVYESPSRGVPVYKLSTVDAERRNLFRLVVVVILIGDVRSKEFFSPPFRLRSKEVNRRGRSLSL